MFNVIYQWKIHEGMETRFQAAWTEATRLITEHRGGLGSRLHVCEDGTYLAYAQWPDEKTWMNSANIPLPETTALQEMAESIAEIRHPLKMQLRVDAFKKEES